MQLDSTSSYPMISLFSGAGGLDIGLERAGFESLVAVEIEEHSCESLLKNKYLSEVEHDDSKVKEFIDFALSQRCFKKAGNLYHKRFFDRVFKGRDGVKYLKNCKILNEDIRDVEANKIQEKAGVEQVFLVAGGPPCQPFSKAGKRKSLDCGKNGDLFNEFVRIVSDIKPKWFLFENVKGLSFTKTDVAYVSCKECGFFELAPFFVRQDVAGNEDSLECEKCGSSSVDMIVRNEKGGSLKIIIKEFERAGYICDYKVLNAADFGAPQIRERLFIVGSLSGNSFDWPVGEFSKIGGAGDSEDLFGSSKKPWRTMREVLWKSGHPDYPGVDLNKAKLWVKNVVRPHDEPVTWSLDRPSPTIGAHQAAKLAFAPKDIPPEQLFRQQWATLGRKQGDTPPVEVTHSYLSDEELLRLQTFPSYWYLHGTRMQRAFQIGNAVPPVLAEAIGYAIIRAETEYVGEKNSKCVFQPRVAAS